MSESSKIPCLKRLEDGDVFLQKFRSTMWVNYRSVSPLYERVHLAFVVGKYPRALVKQESKTPVKHVSLKSSAEVSGPGIDKGPDVDVGVSKQLYHLLCLAVVDGPAGSCISPACDGDGVKLLWAFMSKIKGVSVTNRIELMSRLHSMHDHVR